MLSHVRDCEGLSVMVETLPEEVEEIEETREKAFDEDLGLLEWAATIRQR